MAVFFGMLDAHQLPITVPAAPTAPVTTVTALPSAGHYLPGSDLEIPGLEAILEYGDASSVKHDRIPGAMLINDHSRVDRARLTQIDGLHDDPESSESRQANADRHGETSGNMLYRGRTLGLTGRVEAGNIGAMRNGWRRLRGQFGVTERDLLIHHPFEVPALTNEWINPNVDVEDYGWATPTSTGGGSAGAVVAGVTDGVSKVGSATLTGAAGAGLFLVFGSLVDIDTTDPSNVLTWLPLTRQWKGEDVWLVGRVKVHSATGAVTSIGVGLVQWPGIRTGTYLATPTPALESVASPSTGAWHTIAVRVPGYSLSHTAEYLTPSVVLGFSGAGTYTVHFTRMAMVFIDAEDPTPASYVGAGLYGFDWKGSQSRSASIGPTRAKNLVADPRFENFSNANRTLDDWTYFPTGITINTPPTRSEVWSGDYVEGSLYFKATKDNTATSRSMGVIALGEDGDANLALVAEGRRYRWSQKVNLIQRPATGNVVATISWIDQAGSAILVHASEAIPLGESLPVVEAVAPEGAVKAGVSVVNPATTTALAVLEMNVSDPCFVDVTDWDPGPFFGVGDVAEEVGNYRRIPRPFLLRRVRKTTEPMKAPEQQSRSRAWRDFTMSLRASDPRVYCLDEHLVEIKLPAVSSLQFVVATGSAFDQSTNPAPAPTGFTYEGESIPVSSIEWTEHANVPGV